MPACGNGIFEARFYLLLEEPSMSHSSSFSFPTLKVGSGGLFCEWTVNVAPAQADQIHVALARRRSGGPKILQCLMVKLSRLTMSQYGRAS